MGSFLIFFMIGGGIFIVGFAVGSIMEAEKKYNIDIEERMALSDQSQSI